MNLPIIHHEATAKRMIKKGNMKMNKPKIAVVISALRFGGNATSAVNIARCLSDHYDVTLIVHERVDQIPYEGKLISLECPVQSGLAGKVMINIKRLIRLKRIARKQRFDYMFIILPISNILNYARYGCTKIVSCRHFGDLQTHLYQYTMMTRTSDAMVFNSKAQMAYFAEKHPELKQKCYAIYNILNIDRVTSLKDEPIEEDVAEFMKDHKCVMTTGRLADSKGLQNLLKSFAIVVKKEPDTRLVMLGDGELKGKVGELISDLHLDGSVMLPGFKKNPFKYISRANVFVLPSFYEGFPNMLIEAMACGTPVIATDCPTGPAEIMRANAKEGNVVTDYGYLIRFIPEQDSSWDAADIRPVHEEFAKAIIHVLYNDKLAHQFVSNAYNRIQDFKEEVISDSWCRLLDKYKCKER